MPTPKKRPSKKAKAAIKAISESKLLATLRSEQDEKDSQSFRQPPPSPRASGPIKPRPSKKRG
jgi:hypothetical protein